MAIPGSLRRWKIVSGGQTGVDRAALDVAIELALEHGGWCPRGRKAEDGPIPQHYRVTETESAKYAVRTERNVLESDATLVLCRGPLVGGTRFTWVLAQRHGRPCRVVDLAAQPDPAVTARWLDGLSGTVLNVAGPRESQAPGIGREAADFLRRVLGDREPGIRDAGERNQPADAGRSPGGSFDRGSEP
jgi:hypothetical protein